MENVQDVTAPVLSQPSAGSAICLWPPNYNWYCWYNTNTDSAVAEFTQVRVSFCPSLCLSVRPSVRPFAHPAKHGPMAMPPAAVP
jgi:hypothetical protein